MLYGIFLSLNGQPFAHELHQSKEQGLQAELKELEQRIGDAIGIMESRSGW